MSIYQFSEESIIEYDREESIIEYETSGMVREDAIECPICFEIRWGVRLPNCSHFICAKCYYTIYKGFVSEKFKQEHPEPIEPEAPPNREFPEYPYICNKKELKVIFNSFGIKSEFEGWFIDENEDLYISNKRNTEYVEDLDDVIKDWFRNDEKIILYEKMLKKYKDSKEEYNKLYTKLYDKCCKDYDKYVEELHEYKLLLDYEKKCNSNQSCPLCRK